MLLSNMYFYLVDFRTILDIRRQQRLPKHSLVNTEKGNVEYLIFNELDG